MAKNEIPVTLVGRKIVEIRAMTGEELNGEGWEAPQPFFPVTCLILDDGQMLYPAQDDEGNGPGALFGRYPNGITFRVEVRYGRKARV